MTSALSKSVYMVLQLIALAFVVVGTPLDMLRARDVDILGNTPCITLWGAKENCYSTMYDKRPSDLFAACNVRLKLWQAAGALALISIVLFFLTVVMGAMRLVCCETSFRWVCLAFNLFCVVTVLAVVVIMIDAYNREDSPCPAMHDEFKFGVGFALLWIGWVVNLLSFGFLMM